MRKLACVWAAIIAVSAYPSLGREVSAPAQPKAGTRPAAAMPSTKAVAVPAGKDCQRPSSDALAALRDHVSSLEAIRFHWSKPDGSDASAIVRRQPNGRAHVVTALVNRDQRSPSGEFVLTSIQMMAETERWTLTSLSIRQGDEGRFISADPADSEWQELWSEILGALVRATGMCVEQQHAGNEKS